MAEPLPGWALSAQLGAESAGIGGLLHQPEEHRGGDDEAVFDGLNGVSEGFLSVGRVGDAECRFDAGRSEIAAADVQDLRLRRVGGRVSRLRPSTSAAGG